MSETTAGTPVGVSLTTVACPSCGNLVPVVCGNVAGLRLDEMIAIALAGADRHHELGGEPAGHLPVHVSVADPTPPPRYIRLAAGLLAPGLGLPADGQGALISIRSRPPEEIRRRLRESNLPAWLVTGLLEELGIPEEPAT